MNSRHQAIIWSDLYWHYGPLWYVWSAWALLFCQLWINWSLSITMTKRPDLTTCSPSRGTPQAEISANSATEAAQPPKCKLGFTGWKCSSNFDQIQTWHIWHQPWMLGVHEVCRRNFWLCDGETSRIRCMEGFLGRATNKLMILKVFAMFLSFQINITVNGNDGRLYYYPYRLDNNAQVNFYPWTRWICSCDVQLWNYKALN